MQERSEEQIISRLFELENDGQAERRVELSGERFMSLLHDPDSGASYVLRHGVDETEGAEVPQGTEFFEYPTFEQAAQAFDQQVAESRAAGELVEEDSTEEIGDSSGGGAELRDAYVAESDDPLVREALVDDGISSEEDEPTSGS